MFLSESELECEHKIVVKIQKKKMLGKDFTTFTASRSPPPTLDQTLTAQSEREEMVRSLSC